MGRCSASSLQHSLDASGHQPSCPRRWLHQPESAVPFFNGERKPSYGTCAKCEIPRSSMAVVNGKAKSKRRTATLSSRGSLDSVGAWSPLNRKPPGSHGAASFVLINAPSHASCPAFDSVHSHGKGRSKEEAAYPRSISPPNQSEMFARDLTARAMGIQRLAGEQCSLICRLL